ncbi:MAG: hypothetical protein NVS3B5_04150 [Sphingomicrobium sp.]
MDADAKLPGEGALSNFAIDSRATEARAVEHGPEAENTVRHELASIHLGADEAKVGPLAFGAIKPWVEFPQGSSLAHPGSP